MDLAVGLALEDPDVMVPFGIDEPQLMALMPSARKVTAGYYVQEVVSLGGLRHMLGIHFDPRDGGRLREFEFFSREPAEVASSFADFDRHLRSTFGPPTESKVGDPWNRDCAFRPVPIRR
jgi:hypothetical protein